MKFKLYKELLSEDNFLSHVFLNTCEKEISQKIAHETTRLMEEENWSKEDIENNRVVEMKLFIEGEEVDLRNFFDQLMKQYKKIIEREASKLVKEKTSEKLREIQGKLVDLEEIADDLSNDIDWNYNENPFEK